MTRVASILSNERHLPLIYVLAFGMPGIPCIYYGSEWGAKARKEEGDPALRPCFESPEWNELSRWIAKLAEAKKQEADGAAAPMSAQERNNLYTTMANEAFDEEERK